MLASTSQQRDDSLNSAHYLIFDELQIVYLTLEYDGVFMTGKNNDMVPGGYIL